ncbi:2-phospho-L-lactate guanylyltransferase [Halomonas elongata]|uniref:2-phospho-L-lactate guanylyltransferase n=1 Tax=Halomonas elongata TaxID=2746 RepID=A0A1B8P781_HALEL|nr:hypothetical protein [Halomonas elongata]OBX38144.1 2-phospho-L-lactate guanylyltransferase [Halomonas elongata]
MTRAPLIVIPVKEFSQAKSRLGSRLSTDHRVALAQRLCERTLRFFARAFPTTTAWSSRLLRQSASWHRSTAPWFSRKRRPMGSPWRHSVPLPGPADTTIQPSC